MGVRVGQAAPEDKTQAAKAALERAICNDPKHAEAHARLASIYFHGLGDLPRAEASLKQAVALNPRDVRSQARYASLLRIQGRSAEALKRVNQALTLVPTASLLWAHEALLKYDIGRYEEALASADHALTIDPGNQMNQGLIALWIRGLCLHRWAVSRRLKPRTERRLQWSRMTAGTIRR